MKFKLFLKIISFFLIISGYLNNIIAEYYSIQVKSFPIVEKDKALQYYNRLKDAGYFVYMHKTKIDKKWWIRIKIGYFDSKDAADQFGRSIKSNSDMDYWINPANVLIDNSNSNYIILTTPSGIWTEKNSNFEEVYTFLPKLYHAGILMETKATASSVSNEIVFYYNLKLIKVNLTSKEAVILKEADGVEGLNSSSPTWSHDGKYIAYMDSYMWEVPTKLWTMQNDGTYDTCIVKDITTQNKVKDFSWHPSKNEIFYIFGSTYGAMDMGGDLYSINVETRKSRMIARTSEKSIYRIEKLRIIKDGIILSIMQLKDGAPLKERITKMIPISVDSLTIELSEDALR